MKIPDNFVSELEKDHLKLLSINPCDYTQEIFDYFPDHPYRRFSKNDSKIFKALMLEYSIFPTGSASIYEPISPVTIKTPLVREIIQSRRIKRSDNEKDNTMWIEFFNTNFSIDELQSDVMPYLVGLTQWAFEDPTNLETIIYNASTVFDKNDNFSKLLLEEIYDEIEESKLLERDHYLDTFKMIRGIISSNDEILSKTLYRFPILKLTMLGK